MDNNASKLRVRYRSFQSSSSEVFDKINQEADLLICFDRLHTPSLPYNRNDFFDKFDRVLSDWVDEIKMVRISSTWLRRLIKLNPPAKS
jgi:hypothetical protein